MRPEDIALTPGMFFLVVITGFWVLVAIEKGWTFVRCRLWPVRKPPAWAMPLFEKTLRDIKAREEGK